MEILILLLLLATNTNIIASKRTKRFFGANCNINEHPSIVSITRSTTTHYERDTKITSYRYGTGVLVTLKWVLTSSEVFFLLHCTGTKVLAGSIYELPSETDQVREVEKIVTTEEYASTEQIVLAELRTPFEESDRVHPAKLPKRAKQVDACEELTLFGWGEIQLKDEPPRDDHKVLNDEKEEHKFGDILKCGKARHILDLTKNPKKLSFDMERGFALCMHDYGFGVFCKDVLVGITDKNGPVYCTKNISSEYLTKAHNVSYYMNWLQQTTGIEIPANFYQISTKPDAYKPRKRRTTETSKRKMVITSSTTEGQIAIPSNGYHIRPIFLIYPVLVGLRLIL